MALNRIRKKFGGDFVANEHTFILGSDIRFTSHFADRFENLNILESCTGAGFTTIQLAKVAKHVISVEIDKTHQKQATQNIAIAELSDKVTFIHGSILDQKLLDGLPLIDAAFLDPDWAVTGPDHKYRFLDSNTQPPADVLLDKMFELTKSVALILPPFVDVKELNNLPNHELERLYIGDSHELFCLYFGKLKKTIGETEFHV